MKINQELNAKLKSETKIFQQYLSLINSKESAITVGYQREAEKAKLDFLSFYLDSVVKVIAEYAQDPQTESILNEQVSSIQSLIKNNDRDTKLCIKKMEETSNYWNSLCY
ncbi:MAG: hypothetical protein HRU06_01305 [Oceanospirillaceae bacterium]|nr:hypothetical protein [Oceanospirillaceae bacterium]